MLNLFRSLFVIVALGCGAVLFNNDSNRLVLRPIERMLRKVCSAITANYQILLFWAVHGIKLKMHLQNYMSLSQLCSATLKHALPSQAETGAMLCSAMTQ